MRKLIPIILTFLLSGSFVFANDAMPFSEIDNLEKNPLFGTRPWEKQMRSDQLRFEKIISEQCDKKQQKIVEEKKRLQEEKIKEEKRKIEEQKKERRDRVIIYKSKPITKGKTYKYQKSVAKKIENSKEYKTVQGKFKWNGPVLNKSNGVVKGPTGRETYYNLPMGGVVSIMRSRGNHDKYWVRSDGCKMLGNYIMVAANLKKYPRGSIVKCSRGFAIVCDTGTFAYSNPNQLDIAVNW